MKKTIGVFPGTFDPVTFGHIDLIHRARRVFDEVIVAVTETNTEKEPLFSLEERIGFLRQATKAMRGVRCEPFSGLVVNFAHKRGAKAMIRGLRMLSDFEYEFQMALTNRKLAEDIETLFLMPHESYATISSRLVKEVASLSGDVRAFVPPYVSTALKRRFANAGR